MNSFNMNILKEVYKKKLIENESNVRFWEEYLQNLKNLDLNFYSDKLTVPILVPIGNRIFFRGALKHTNEITVALGADYFAKCSLKQAEILRQHRIKGAEPKLETLKKEKEYLKAQINFGKQSVYDNIGQEIIEVQTEEEDRAWRKQHREKVKQYYQQRDKNENLPNNNITDEELWNRLEELELQEELENELSQGSGDESDAEELTEREIPNNTENKDDLNDDEHKIIYSETNVQDLQTKVDVSSKLSPKEIPKLDLLEQVLHKQNELEKTLTDIKNRERCSSKTESDIMSRLDELEQLEEIEDEIDRLDDILQQDNKADSETEDSPTQLKRSVCFADEDNSETLEITFKHSNVEPYGETYDPEKGILKPSDIYKAYSHLFTEKTSILSKKSKYEMANMQSIKKNGEVAPDMINQNTELKHISMEPNAKRTIVVKDITEKEINESKLEEKEKRPMSIFKKRRQQKS